MNGKNEETDKEREVSVNGKARRGIYRAIIYQSDLYNYFSLYLYSCFPLTE